jgi:hypothetical protein
MSDRKLELTAEKYHISPMSLPPGDADFGHAFVDRDRIIGILVARDNALRTKLTIILSIVAVLVSIASAVFSLLRR